jgi:hypothetical protein
MSEFEQIVNERYDETKLQDGYAPFCKHLFIENDFTNGKCIVLEITPENEKLLRTKYEARNDKEVCFKWCTSSSNAKIQNGYSYPIFTLLSTELFIQFIHHHSSSPLSLSLFCLLLNYFIKQQTNSYQS